MARGLLRCLGRQKTFGVAETRRRGRSRRDQWGWGRRSRNASSSPARQRRYRPPAAHPLSGGEPGQGDQGAWQGRRHARQGQCKGVVNAATAASALSSTQDNTVRFADVMRRLAVQGTVQPVGGEGTAQHWTATIGLVVTGGLGMADVHGRPAAKDVTAAANCDHAQVSVVTASDVHLSRGQTIEVLEQVLLAVRQDVIDRPSPPDAGGRCRPRVLTEKPKVKRVVLSQPQRRARVRREAQEAAIGHAGVGEQGRCCFCRRRPATVKCACRTCAVRDRESVPSRPLCEPVNDGVNCAAGDFSGISAGEPTCGMHIS